MPKKRGTKKRIIKKDTPKLFSFLSLNKDPNKKENDLTLGQKAADKVTTWAGSWTFILSLMGLMAVWMAINVIALTERWDPYPFILLNFVLSTLAALQAPIILMSQNRQSERDRIKADRDYGVNRKSEREATKIIGKLEYIEQVLNEIKKKRK